MTDAISAALFDLRLAVGAAVERGYDWAVELDSDAILLDVDERGIAFDLAGTTYGVLRRGDLRDDRFWRERRTGELIDAELFDFIGRVLWSWFGRDLGASERSSIVRCICARRVLGDARLN